MICTVLIWLAVGLQFILVELGIHAVVTDQGDMK